MQWEMDDAGPRNPGSFAAQAGASPPLLQVGQSICIPRNLRGTSEINPRGSSPNPMAWRAPIRARERILKEAHPSQLVHNKRFEDNKVNNKTVPNKGGRNRGTDMEVFPTETLFPGE